MARVKFLSATDADGVVHERQYAVIHCPACGYEHTMGIGPQARVQWSFNGDTAAPVFQPSLLAM